MFKHSLRPTRPSGFTLVEALIAMSITAVAGGALLASLATAVNTSSHTAHLAIARGLVEQLLDEIAAVPYPEATNTTLPPGTPRRDFDDIDDFDGWSKSPPQDRNGWQIGLEGYDQAGTAIPRMEEMEADFYLMERFRRYVTVERVEVDPLSGWYTVTVHGRYRRVTVGVDYTDARGLTSTYWTATRVLYDVPFAP